MIPAHKQTDPSKAPGQIKNDITLGDYYERKEKAYKEKLTFEEWWKINGIGGAGLYEISREAWKAAQENM